MNGDRGENWLVVESSMVTLELLDKQHAMLDFWAGIVSLLRTAGPGNDVGVGADAVVVEAWEEIVAVHFGQRTC